MVSGGGSGTYLENGPKGKKQIAPLASEEDPTKSGTGGKNSLYKSGRLGKSDCGVVTKRSARRSRELQLVRRAEVPERKTNEGGK